MTEQIAQLGIAIDTHQVEHAVSQLEEFKRIGEEVQFIDIDVGIKDYKKVHKNISLIEKSFERLTGKHALSLEHAVLKTAYKSAQTLSEELDDITDPNKIKVDTGQLSIATDKLDDFNDTAQRVKKALANISVDGQEIDQTLDSARGLGMALQKLESPRIVDINSNDLVTTLSNAGRVSSTLDSMSSKRHRLSVDSKDLYDTQSGIVSISNVLGGLERPRHISLSTTGLTKEKNSLKDIADVLNRLDTTRQLRIELNGVDTATIAINKLEARLGALASTTALTAPGIQAPSPPDVSTDISAKDTLGVETAPGALPVASDASLPKKKLTTKSPKAIKSSISLIGAVKAEGQLKKLLTAATALSSTLSSLSISIEGSDKVAEINRKLTSKESKKTKVASTPSTDNVNVYKVIVEGVNEAVNELKKVEDKSKSIKGILKRLEVKINTKESIAAASRLDLPTNHTIDVKTSGIDSAIDKSKAFNRSLGSANQSFIALNDTATALGVTMAGYTGVQAVQGFVGIAGTYEATLLEFQAKAQASNEELARADKLFRQLGGSTRYTAEEVAATGRELAAQGRTLEQIEFILPSVLQANTLRGQGAVMSETAKLMSDMMASYGMDAAQAKTALDKLMFATTKSSASFEELGLTFSYVGPIASKMGTDFDELIALTMTLADAGLRGERAGTALRGVFMGTIKETGDSIKVLEKLNIPLATLQDNTIGLTDKIKLLNDASMKDLESLFGTEAAPGILSLINQFDEIPKKAAEVTLKSQGITQDMVGLMDEALLNKIASLKSAWEELVIKFGESGAMESMKEMIDSLTEFLRSIDQNDIENFVAALEIMGSILAGKLAGKIASGASEMSMGVTQATKTMWAAEQAQSAASGANTRLSRSLAGVGASARIAGKGLKVLGGSVVSFFGGPVGAAIAALLTAFGAIGSKIDEIQKKVEDAVANANQSAVSVVSAADVVLTGTDEEQDAARDVIKKKVEGLRVSVGQAEEEVTKQVVFYLDPILSEDSINKIKTDTDLRDKIVSAAKKGVLDPTLKSLEEEGVLEVDLVNKLFMFSGRDNKVMGLENFFQKDFGRSIISARDNAIDKLEKSETVQREVDLGTYRGSMDVQREVASQDIQKLTQLTSDVYSSDTSKSETAVKEIDQLTIEYDRKARSAIARMSEIAIEVKEQREQLDSLNKISVVGGQIELPSLFDNEEYAELKQKVGLYTSVRDSIEKASDTAYKQSSYTQEDILNKTPAPPSESLDMEQEVHVSSLIKIRSEEINKREVAIKQLSTTLETTIEIFRLFGGESKEVSDNLENIVKQIQSLTTLETEEIGTFKLSESLENTELFNTIKNARVELGAPITELGDVWGDSIDIVIEKIALFHERFTTSIADISSHDTMLSMIQGWGMAFEEFANKVNSTKLQASFVSNAPPSHRPTAPADSHVALEKIAQSLVTTQKLLDTDANKNVSIVQVAGAYAKGGEVSSNKPILVGEEGPEIFTPTEDGYIIPNAPTEKIIRQNPDISFSTAYDTFKLDGMYANGGTIKKGDTVLVGEEGPELFTAHTEGVILTNKETSQISDERAQLLSQKKVIESTSLPSASDPTAVGVAAAV